jgi:S-DNA-T family DNA segregation ATPase FtsK/SpoIIIE
MLLIHDWDSLRHELDAVDATLMDRLVMLAVSGTQAGIHTAITGPPALPAGTSRLTNWLRDQAPRSRIVLAGTDPEGYRDAGWPRGMASPVLGAGSGILFPEAVEVRIARVSAISVGTVGQVSPAAAGRVIDSRQPVLFARLPRPLPIAAAAHLPVVGATRASIPAPVGATAAPVGLRVVDLAAYRPGLLISGPARSGRTTALASIFRVTAGEGCRAGFAASLG